MIRWVAAILFFSSISSGVLGQKQLVVLKDQKVLLRLYPGDEIIFSLKGSKQRRRSYVNNLSDTAVLAHHQVVPYHQIDKIYFKRKNLLNVVGGLLVTGGIGYFLIDQVNITIVQGNAPDVDEDVALSSAVMIGAGLPMLLSKKNHARIGGRYRILTVDKGSGFYMPDLRREMDGTETD